MSEATEVKTTPLDALRNAGYRVRDAMRSETMEGSDRREAMRLASDLAETIIQNEVESSANDIAGDYDSDDCDDLRAYVHESVDSCELVFSSWLASMVAGGASDEAKEKARELGLYSVEGIAFCELEAKVYDALQDRGIDC